MKRFAMLMICMLALPGLSLAAEQAGFEGGRDEVIVELAAPGYEATVNLTVPAGYYVTNATMKVTGMAAEKNASAFAENVSITLDNSTIWAFQQVGFGPLGMQDQFSTGQKQAKLNFGTGGAERKQFIRLPKDAIVQSAKMEVKGFPPSSGQELVNFTGSGNGDWFGFGVANAGDVNNDGFDDIIIGAPLNDAGADSAGQAYIYYGGPNPDAVADVVFTGDPTALRLGYRVSGAGDVNNDGYDDVIISAWGSSKVILYFGGQNMDNTADITFYKTGDALGLGISCAGDINNDGYDDVIIGAPYANSNTGKAYIFYGGINMDNSSDLTLLGENQGGGGHFGECIACMDMNGDGFDDIIVGAPDVDHPRGRIYIYFGNKDMDTVPDIIIRGEFLEGGKAKIGYALADAGDVNQDGYKDLIVGAFNYPRAYLFLGGSNMDNVSDVEFIGMTHVFSMGTTVSSAGDMDNDGYNDIIISGVNETIDDTLIGRAYVYLGGDVIDNSSDLVFCATIKDKKDLYGNSVSGGGDVNGDGYDDIIIGAAGNYSAGDKGRASLHTFYVSNLTGILNPSITIGSNKVWSEAGYFNRTVALDVLADDINAYMRSHQKSDNDGFENAYIDVPVIVNASDQGTISLSKLAIIYSYSASVPNFTSLLGNYLAVHQNDSDDKGNIRVPIKIQAMSAGRVRLSRLDIALSLDKPPTLTKNIGDVELLENGWNSTLVDLYVCFQDDRDADNQLDFNVVSATNSTYVTVGIRPNDHYLAADAFSGDANDNWTGTVEVVVACSDHLGHKTESNQFTITIVNVNDEPLITSSPVYNASAGVPYTYNVTAIDGDNDPLWFSLSKAPPNMTIDADSGEIAWMPRARGTFDVRVAVSDGTVTVEQIFSILVLNKMPRITSTPPLNATTGARYTYTVTAEDDNFDILTYSLTSKIVGMEIGSTTGTISWTPEYANSYDVVVVVSDGKATAMQEFTVKVSQANRAPKFISIPVKTATAGLPYEYQAKAMDEDGDSVTLSLVEPPAGMTIDNGKVGWTPSAAGNFTIKIMASDGRGGEKLQEFVVSVKDRVKPSVLISRPSASEKVKGKFTVTGTAVKGTLEVASVQVRVDGGAWQDAAGNYTWQYGLDTTKLKNGKHSLEARAFDGKEYSEVAKVDFTVDNQKIQGKGFIPGFEMGILIVAFVLVAILGLGQRRQNRRNLR